MAQKEVELDPEKLSCSICVDQLKDPVTIPCGHRYCMKCIESHWDREDENVIYSCPQCRETFTPRPVLGKRILLTEIVEEPNKTGHQAADYCYAGAEDVTCDVCTGRKRKAVKSCLVCLASYCEKDVQPHYEAPAFKKHKLVEPKNLQENICSCHDEVMKIFCRTDQQLICYLCAMDEHRGHNKVSAAAERTERQRELEVSRQNIQQRTQDREKDVKLLQQELENIDSSAYKAVEDSEKMFTKMIRVIKKKCCDVKKQISSQHETEKSRVQEVVKELKQEITELKSKDAEMKQLLDTEDHNQFLHNYPLVPEVSESKHSSRINICPQTYFEELTASVSEVKDKVQKILRDGWTHNPPKPKTRAEFLKYSCDITLDPNTTNTQLVSDGDRKVKAVRQLQSYPDHSDRFTDYRQVLSRESLTERCYWEVELRGLGAAVAVSYKDISRAASESEFGSTDKSWALQCYKDSWAFLFNNAKTSIPVPQSSRIGVYLDYSEGILSFYSVSETMTLLHKVQTKFNQPLHAGLNLVYFGSSAEFFEPK
ncbi:tripartite motif-containing protein 16-like [Stegastes partitus]|uniref:Tripartite motif-containing protein 16-like n=1 Tax=Stegastes partitus TaxID=144197 RepID=A0A3B5B8I7_9TELE|nr:PREDICTED: tripartite motif-containing protein 16-like [Stegastes partitus]